MRVWDVISVDNSGNLAGRGDQSGTIPQRNPGIAHHQDTGKDKFISYPIIQMLSKWNVVCLSRISSFVVCIRHFPQVVLKLEIGFEQLRGQLWDSCGSGLLGFQLGQVPAH
jgi:hypothetical protein